MIGADDFAIFFDVEEFGEVVELDGTVGLVAIWEAATADLPVGDTAVVVDTNLFRLPAAQQPSPFEGAELVVARTGQRFVLIGEPRLAGHGGEWVCEAQPL